MTEYDAADNVVFDATLSATSYRQYRFEWTGAPNDNPAVVSTATSGNLSITVSWNGDTRTSDWRVLTGPNPASLTASATVARDGFETTATVPQATYVAMEALDESGAVLGRSETIVGGAWFQEAAYPPVNGTYTTLVGDFGGTRNDDVVFYAPGSGPDYLHVSNGDGTRSSQVLPTINGTYTPLVGDFVGDDRDEILFTRGGQSVAYLWRFDRNSRDAAIAIDSRPLIVPSGFTIGTITQSNISTHTHKNRCISA